jgi:serine/threonine protein kinase
MWAVGCVTVVLLTGALPFLDPKTKEYSQALADECNLEILESSSEWSEVSAAPKDFVGKLLLEETRRLTAGGALQHQWFNNELHKTDFEELYKRTIRHWQPKVHKKPIIEFLNAREVKNLECSKEVLASERKPRGRGDRTPIEPPVCIL